MRDWMRHIMIFVAAMATLNVMAVEEPNDTVCLYYTWEQILDMEPDTVLINPFIDVCTPYEVYIETGERNIDSKIRMNYIAASLSDSVWVINSEYLRKMFGCRRNSIQGYVPVFFSEKTAFITAQEIEEVPGFSITKLKERYYYIDFVNRKVKKITSKSLYKLLEDYSDLQQRFVNMNDCDDDRVIKVFFLMYIDRANEDTMRPNILDLVD